MGRLVDLDDVKALIEDIYKRDKDTINTSYKKDNIINWLDEIDAAKQNSLEDFAREFPDYVDWSAISINQKLSESFIREFKDKVNWRYIFMCQTLSEDFIKEFSDYVDH